MANYQIEDIKILIADSNRQLRTSLKGVLHHHGFRGIVDAPSIEAFEAEVRVVNPDLILCDIDLKGGHVCESIKKLRHNELGQNPFAAVILFIEEATEGIVTMASEAGLDDLQIKPVVAQKVIDRVTYLIEKRKPFVVTTDYVGPDRRKAARPGTQQIPSVEVPNTMAAKASGTYDPRMVQSQIDKALWDVNAQKIERHVFQVGYLVERIVPAYEAGEVTKKNMEMVIKLMKVGRDIVERLEDSDYGHIADLAGTLVTVTKSLWDSGTLPKHKDLELLPQLSAALAATFNTDAVSAAAVQKIRSTIQDEYK
ncbi:putative Response regulator consisting of a CheY-like receiver domain [Candidatus Terasakiella magnetica]|uniref:Putative Response regulator consisting of a CheY-like receiver domain n=1 Tax=Candidatus Terasakiella magnetica TaxID=1867952 RepID=A0A1C3RLH0_9PROT|nr:response regulator [Candidatus Terasakiella magnetica]SCA58039.1 putative Response regulator consisting of a CheY-like receiver domain [Candidatus Terasakiella magnetica]